ncbi:MAG: UDP-N-acetylglucosamine 2-epimerase (non-hydrolyzing) [Myxococcota bacterium]|nr:UDP-N-acetylglucosamine 2-epimerase (non-hydrolyzing) [Myxococcota bacterium]
MSARIAIVLGTRPEAIKMAPVHLALRDHPTLDVKLIVTAQHRQLLDHTLDGFGITPDVDLDLMQPDQSLAELTGRVVVGVQRALEQLRPGAVLVHGDTTTCMAAALAGFYAGVDVGHVEAGLRTGNLRSPFPEEANRRLTDPLCRWCFAPTSQAADSLRAEGTPQERILVTGNTVIDALLLMRDKVRGAPPELSDVPAGMLEGHRLILVTGHRRESFGRPFESFCKALRDVVERNPDALVVYPVHLNPNVQRPVRALLGGHDRIRLIDPQPYLPFVYLMDRSYLIVTDSGGIQEEAPSLGKPVLVSRTVTERPEAVAAGLAKLVGTDRRAIVREIEILLNDRHAYERMSLGASPYGDGRAAGRIVERLDRDLNG